MDICFHLVFLPLQAVAKAMRTSKVDKPSKVYVVTHKTSSGSVGQNSGGKVCRNLNIYHMYIYV